LSPESAPVVVVVVVAAAAPRPLLLAHGKVIVLVLPAVAMMTALTT
jgi:hypothetical protein